MKNFAVWHAEIGERWDLKGAQAALFKAEHPDFVPFGTFIEERLMSVRASSQPDKEWPVYGVSNRTGVFLSHLQLGANFNVPYKAIEPDWFFHNPTRANVGSLGRVPEVLPDALTSPEYQVWSIKEDAGWLPEYVEALIKMPFFNLLIQVHRVGAVKERLYTRNLMEVPVPNRGRKFQEQMVAKWNALQLRMADMQNGIAVHEEALVTGVLQASGILIHVPPARARAYSMPLNEISRWGVGFNRETWTLEDILSTTLFPRVPLSSVARVNPGRVKELAPASLVTFVQMEAVSEISGAIVDGEEVLLEEVSRGYTPFEEGDLIWAKITPCMQNGKSAVARNLTNGVGFGSTEFHVIRPINSEETLPEYLWVLLRLASIRNAAKRFFIGSAGQQRVPADFLGDLVIPLPPKEVQRTIVDSVTAKRAIVEEERKRLEELRQSSLLEVERDIVEGRLI